MAGRAIAISFEDSRRFRLTALLAFFLILAQLLFSAHADDIADHAPQSCEYCLAAALSDDPNDLVVELAPPELSFECVRRPVAAGILVENASYAANPRGPPYC